MMITAFRFLALGAGMVALSGLVQAQAPLPRGTPGGGAVEVSGAPPRVDPEREKVERVDAAVRDSQEERITDPTVFVKSAALGALTQIELAKLAQSKSQDANVKGFAARMLKDQEAIRAELAAIAKRKRLDVPTSLVYEDEQTVQAGAEKPAEEFDAWYAQQMIAEHQEAIGLFQGAAKMQDADFSAFAKKTLPVLEEHQRSASALRP